MDEKPVRPRARGQRPEETVRARDGEARAVGYAEPSSCRAVPSLREAPGLGEGFRRAHPEVFGIRLRIVHERVPARDAHPRGFGRPEHRVRMAHRAHVQERRRAAREELGEAEACRNFEGRLVVRGLAGPDVRFQPREEWKVIRAVSEQRLAEMDVRLDETGHEPESARVHAFERAARGGDFGGSLPRVCMERDDRAVLDEEGAVQRHVVRSRHSEDARALDEKDVHAQQGIIPRGRGRGANRSREEGALVCKEPALAGEPAAVSREPPVGADDAMAGDDDRDRVRAVRARDRADGRRPADLLREARV